MRQCCFLQERRCDMHKRQRHEIPRRATAEQLPTYRAGHYSGIHPEDAPYLTDKRKRYPANPLDLADDLDYPGEKTRMPTSAVRYVDTRGNQVIQRGNQRFVIHDEPPPRRRRRPHWLVISGMSMVVLLLLWWLLNVAATWWTQH